MADELLIATFDGYVTKVEKQPDGTWVVVITNLNGDVTFYTNLYEVYVMPCSDVKLGDSIGKRRRDGGITSVCITAPFEFNVSNSPMIDNGCIGLTWKTVGPGKVLAGPVSGASALPVFRDLTFTDLKLKVLRARFTVGAVGAPVAGATTFQIIDALSAPIPNKVIHFYRERDWQFLVRDFAYVTSSSQVNLVVPFENEEDVEIFMWPIELFENVNVGTTAPVIVGDVLLINDTDGFLINDTDYLII